MDVGRRSLLIAAAAAGSAAALTVRAASAAIDSAVDRFARLPATASCLIEAADPKPGWSAGHDPAAALFIGSAVKTFILAQYLRDVEAGVRSEDDQKAIDDRVRSPSSPVFLDLSGTTPARSVLEAMIAHSDNTATDVALATVGPDRVRALIAAMGLSSVRIPHSTRRLFSYLAGAPEGADLGWAEMQRLAKGELAGKPRAPVNDQETMVGSAADMVRWYRAALQPSFFAKPETRIEFKRIQAMADALAYVVPADTPAYGKGGSIDWKDFHCFSLAGQMVVRTVPVTFCFTINWNGPDDSVSTVFPAYKKAVADALQAAAQAIA
jgi:beta-lactamase class A